jgi:hypothetical protein
MFEIPALILAVGIMLCFLTVLVSLAGSLVLSVITLQWQTWTPPWTETLLGWIGAD